jgi:hypothetical protein
MAGLHPFQMTGIDQLPAGEPVALLTRHSLRELGTGVPTYDLPLTSEGVALAETWGGYLPRPLHRFYSSPVGRCIDTSQAMARGAGASLAVTPALTLVEPGCFVEDIMSVGPLFLNLGPLGFANRHFQESLPGLLSPETGSAKIIRHVNESLGPAGSLTVHVTHDTILAAFIYHLLGRSRIDEEDWPWMMEGVWLWFDGNDLRWLWRGESGRRDIRSYYSLGVSLD